MSTAVVPLRSSSSERVLESPVRLPRVPWRNPYTVSPAELAVHIRALEGACRQQPQCADLRTCLGMAYAMNFQVYESMDSLEEARRLDGTHFFAQFKYAELLYRLRALPQAEQETAKAIELSSSSWEYSMALKQLQLIRDRIREGTQKPEWTKPLTTPAIALLVLFVVLSTTVMVWR